jgi:hypothetical protein
MGRVAEMKAAVSIFRLLRHIADNKSFELKDQSEDAWLQR